MISSITFSPPPLSHLCGHDGSPDALLEALEGGRLLERGELGADAAKERGGLLAHRAHRAGGLLVPGEGGGLLEYGSSGTWERRRAFRVWVFWYLWEEEGL